jgi:hypothetical protein
VKLVLRHNGHDIPATCNNYKATPDPGKIVGCNLQVGESVKCQYFPDPMASSANGYDLICGNERENGNLSSSANNELLQFEKPPKKRGQPQSSLTVVYDQYWSSDYAANGAEMQCPSTAVRNMCRDQARADESKFEGEFSAHFQSDPMCSGLELIVFEDPKKMSQVVLSEYTKATENGYWYLKLDFTPNETKQPWQLSLNPAITHQASGEGDAGAISHTICSIAKRTGGSVID